MIHFVWYYIFYALVWVFTLLPLSVQYFFADILFFLVFYIVKYRRKVVLKNITNAFPEKTTEERYEIMLAFYHHLADYFVESMALMHMSKHELYKRYKYLNPELPRAYSLQGKSIMLVAAHYGNWEWSVCMPEVLNMNVLAIYKPLRSSRFDHLFRKLRGKCGVEPVAMGNIMRRLLENKRNNVPSCPYILADQRPMGKDSKFWTTFLNQDSPIFLGVEKISQKLNLPVFFLKVTKVKRGYYEAEFIHLADETATLPLYELTEMHVRVLEKMIQAKPEYWLWSHKRWKHKKSKAQVEAQRIAVEQDQLKRTSKKH